MDVSRVEAGRLMASRGDCIAAEGHCGQVLRVISGVFVMERVDASGQLLVQLAWPGDLIGLETLWTRRYDLTVTAMTDGVLQSQPLESEAAIQMTTVEGYLQLRRSLMEMIELRSGPVRTRLDRFLRLLEEKGRLRREERSREGLPALRDVAQVIDSTTESVCRELKVLLPRYPNRRPERGNLQPAFVPALH